MRLLYLIPGRTVLLTTTQIISFLHNYHDTTAHVHTLFYFFHYFCSLFPQGVNNLLIFLPSYIYPQTVNCLFITFPIV